MLLLLFVVGVLTLGIAGLAFAAGPYYVGGGKWYHSTQGQDPVYSNYYHGTRCHTSNVWNGVYNPSGPTRAGYWARASAPNTFRVDRVYWNNSC
jgi:lactococcin 972 family bacteriocin